MIYLEHWWGTQTGWPWGFYNVIPNPIHGTTGFHVIWEMFPAFPPVDPIYYAALIAVIGVFIDTALIIISIIATSRKWFLSLTAIINIGFGVTTIIISAAYTVYSGSLIFTPLGILLVALGGILIYQITRSLQSVRILMATCGLAQKKA